VTLARVVNVLSGQCEKMQNARETEENVEQCKCKSLESGGRQVVNGGCLKGKEDVDDGRGDPNILGARAT